MLIKNQVIPLNIESVTSTGSGVGHCEGIAVFVPMTAAGDELMVRIVKVMSSYCFGIVESVTRPSPDRTEPDCGVYRQCGGCALRHISYEAELQAKQTWVRDAIERIGGFSLTPEPILPSPRVTGYRNKAQYPFGRDDNGIFCGFYAPRSHRVVRCASCPLQPAVFSEIAGAVCHFAEEEGLSLYDEMTGLGLLRHLYLRIAEATGEIMVCLVINGDRIPAGEKLVAVLRNQFPAVASVMLNCNRRNTNVILGDRDIVLSGKDHITDILCGITVELSPRSFYQVNHDGAEQLYRCAAEMASLQKGELLLDLYCGTGTIGLSMAKDAGRLIGVEIIESAVENARKNAKLAGIGNAEFICADASLAASKLAAQGLHPDVVVLDPPRKGCDSSALEAVVSMAPQRIVMVSCNPSTMARDAKVFAAMGYQLCRIRPVDMFPRTAHVECVVLMSRVEK